MILIDVNVLVYAHREDAPRHRDYKKWLDGVVNGQQAYGISDLALSGFLRVVTHPRIFSPPSEIEKALVFVSEIRDRTNCIPTNPGDRHWEIFTRLCREAEVRGNLVPDAYFAALAIESDCEWVTTDSDFERFSELRWRHPLKETTAASKVPDVSQIQ